METLKGKNEKSKIDGCLRWNQLLWLAGTAERSGGAGSSEPVSLKFLGTETEVIGASRTDAGVHALGNVAVFDTEARMPAEKFSYALNTRLPQDIRIQDSCQVPEDFHPRFQETIKTYEYKIYNRQFPDPTKRLYTYFYYYPLDAKDAAGSWVSHRRT